MKVSSKGLTLIREAEGFSSNAYICPAGEVTIGYGNTFWEDGRKVKIGEQISKSNADRLLDFVANKYFGEKILELVKVPLNQNQFDALLSFTYNIGIGNFKTSTLLKKINENDFIGAANEFLKWNKSGKQVFLGLTRRRERERELFLAI